MTNDCRIEFEHDRLRDRDRRALLRLAGQEKRELVAQTNVAPGIDMQVHEVRVEIWRYNGDATFPPGTVFDVRGIKDDIAKGRIPCSAIRIDMTESWVTHIGTNGGIDESRVSSLEPHMLGRIAVGIMMPSKSLMIVDGNHRIVRRWRDGLRDVRIAVVEWRSCMRHVLPPGT